VEVVGSNATVWFWNKSRPANAPARPTLPILSKSTRGREAWTRAGRSRKRGIAIWRGLQIVDTSKPVSVNNNTCKSNIITWIYLMLAIAPLKKYPAIY
jgi:hypothetical protein